MLRVNETLFMHFYSLPKKVKLGGKTIGHIKYHVAQTIHFTSTFIIYFYLFLNSVSLFYILS